MSDRWARTRAAALPRRAFGRPGVRDLAAVPGKDRLWVYAREEEGDNLIYEFS